MKKIINSIKIFAILLTLFAAQNSNAQCAPNFTYTINGGNVTFTSTSTNVSTVTTNYFWNFGNGNTANGNNMVTAATVYTANGTYVVSLFVVSTAPTCSNQISYTLAITGATTTGCNLNANFTSSQGANGLVNFNNTSTGTTGSTTYSWDFGDSSPLSTATSPGHTYAANGSYIVTLVADNNVSPACISTKTTVVVVNSYCNLNASFIATPGSNGSVSFVSNSTGTSPSSNYQWNFGDNTTGSGASVNHVYSTGNYNVILTVTNFSTFPVCSDTVMQIVSVTNGSCNLNANFTYNQSSNGNVNFTNLSTGINASSVTFNWNFGDASPASTVSSPAHVYAANGTYIVTMNVNNNTSPACASTKTAAVIVNSYCNLLANFVATPGANGSVSFVSTSTGTTGMSMYNWSFGDNTNGSGASTNHVYSNGTYNVLLTVTNFSTNPVCQDTVIHTVVVTSNTCVANAGFSLVPTSTPQHWNAFPSAPANVTSAVWSWGDGNTSNTLYTSHIYTASANYQICLSVTVACGATHSTCTTYFIYKPSSGSDNSGIISVNVVDPAAVGVKNAISTGFDFNLSPNPNNGQFKVNIKGLESGTVNLNVTSFDGKLILQTNAETNNGALVKDIDLGNATNGIYFIKATTGTKTVTQKIVISN
jgi:PKD repeat protein